LHGAAPGARAPRDRATRHDSRGDGAVAGRGNRSEAGSLLRRAAHRREHCGTQVAGGCTAAVLRTGAPGADPSGRDRTHGRSEAVTETPVTAEDEVVQLCRDLIRIDTPNPTQVERPAAEYVAENLSEVGLEPVVVESAPGRASVFARVSG